MRAAHAKGSWCHFFPSMSSLSSEGAQLLHLPRTRLGASGGDGGRRELELGSANEHEKSSVWEECSPGDDPVEMDMLT